MRQEILVGPERRRRWSDQEKISILREVGIDGLGVSDVARRHGISRQNIYQWRTAMRRGELVDREGMGFLAVELSETATEELPSPRLPNPDPQVEIVVAKGRVVRAPASVSVALLKRLIRAVEAA